MTAPTKSDAEIKKNHQMVWLLASGAGCLANVMLQRSRTEKRYRLETSAVITRLACRSRRDTDSGFVWDERPLDRLSESHPTYGEHEGNSACEEERGDESG
jgi:hypothetical protein